VQNALIFCNRKVDVDILFKSLSKHRFSAGALHGDMAQTIRFSTLEKFKAGELKLLVCSDVAARGLDIGGLSHVFNFDVPIHAEDYVHRIGRTGRAGLEGHAFTIASPDDRYAVEAIEKLISHPIPPMLVEGLDPVDWAEHDGRKRRGRKRAEPKRGESRKSPEKDKAEKDKAVIAKPDREKPARTERAKSEKDKPREPRARRERTKDERPRPERAAALEPVTQDVPSMARSSERPPRRDDARRDDPRRERYRRDEDLGPEVVGFGDDVPAFMTLRGRRAQAPESQLSENSEA
jgi:superfamily II DNA/RNA helicase